MPEQAITAPSSRATTDSGHYDAAYYAENNNNYRQRFEFVIANLWRALYIRFALHPRSLVDAGGGMGLLVERLRRWGCGALGLEVSHYAIRQAPPEVARAFAQGSITALPFADASLDAVVSVNVFEHLVPDEVPGALRECARVARDGMYLEITVLEDASVIHRDPTHHTKLRANDWLALMQRTLPDWRASRGLRVPRYKNGIFILTRTGRVYGQTSVSALPH